MKIPVFHDDQHGTAIIVGAAVLTALQIAGKDIRKVKVATTGAGAAGIACLELLVALGVRTDNILALDREGVRFRAPPGLDSHKALFTTEPTQRRRPGPVCARHR